MRKLETIRRQNLRQNPVTVKTTTGSVIAIQPDTLKPDARAIECAAVATASGNLPSSRT
jgi:hypothetical protein